MANEKKGKLIEVLSKHIPYGIDFTNFRNGYVAYWKPLPQPPKGD